MNWQTRFESNPQFSQAMRFATDRPPWVLKATGAVALVMFLIPLIALAVLLVAAFAVTAVAWFFFSMIARVIDAMTGHMHATPQDKTQDAADGRINVRVIERP